MQKYISTTIEQYNKIQQYNNRAVQQYSSSKIQQCKNTAVQQYSGSTTQYSSTTLRQCNNKIQQYNNTIQEYNNIAVKKYSSTTTQQFNNIIQHYNNTILITPCTTAYGPDIVRSGLICPSVCLNKQTNKQQKCPFLTI